jgi:hypothetical protein
VVFYAEGYAAFLIPAPDPQLSVIALGTWSKPEDLKAALGPYERIGQAMADDCREDTDTTWGHDLLRHNAIELERLRKHVHPILFLNPQK